MPWTHALDLAKATTKAGGVHTPVVRAGLKVSGDLLRLIRTGDAVIREARTLMPHGAGNQTSDHRHHPESGPRTAATQIAYAQVGGVAFNAAKPQIIGGAALAFESGNCQDQAAVVYLLLREKLDANYIVSYGCAPGYHHSFCLVRHALTLSHDGVVAVDSWPKYAQAVRWVDHFTYPDWQLYVEKNGAGVAGKIAAARQKYNNQAAYVAVANQAVQTGPYQPSWNHKWASRSQQVLVYDSDDMDVG